ncbi:PTS sugar transporter subunit IIC [uncultured Parolsenella sp.]|uniref:PTS mannose/fructose/sorbose/N-acetylgalactosamine transporter subunit IIC n=1 Tax=uncultured Parolsenella sp. TaxID=2083008 RepID=UPI0025E52822|nr:PTS sugar transporter subunit IIC [uncultured Parolsenella sp.]
MMQAALLTAVAYFICYAGNWMFGQCMTERPLVVGPIVGLFLGDPVTGLMLGATLEAIYMGAVNIGGSISSEPATATAFATAFAITSGISQDAAVALAIPIGVVAAFVFMFLNNVAFNLWVPLIDKFAEDGALKKLLALNWFTWFLRFFILAVIMFLGVYLGSGVVQAFMDNIPDVVMRGLKAAGGLMPAVGLAILMKMLWSKELAVYYLLGFVLVIYFGIPLVALAALGVIIVVITAMRDIEIKNLKASGAAAASNENDTDDVEGFLS